MKQRPHSCSLMTESFITQSNMILTCLWTRWTSSSRFPSKQMIWAADSGWIQANAFEWTCPFWKGKWRLCSFWPVSKAIRTLGRPVQTESGRYSILNATVRGKNLEIWRKCNPLCYPTVAIWSRGHFGWIDRHPLLIAFTLISFRIECLSVQSGYCCLSLAYHAFWTVVHLLN